MNEERLATKQMINDLQETIEILESLYEILTEDLKRIDKMTHALKKGIDIAKNGNINDTVKFFADAEKDIQPSTIVYHLQQVYELINDAANDFGSATIEDNWRLAR